MNLLGLLLKGLGSKAAINVLKKKTGISSKDLAKFLPLLIPILLKAMTSNASSESGAHSLLGALSQHTSTEPLAEQIDHADTQDGQAIIGHILGGNSNNVVNQLSGQSGLSSSQINDVMALIAPAVLSGLSAANTTTQQVQAPKPKPGADAEVLSLGGQQAGGLGSFLQMFGAAQEPEVQEQSSSSLIQSLLGGQEEQNSSNGSALLSLLLRSKK